MPLTVVFAPDSFKGSASADAAASALAAGWASVRPADQLVQKPMADGGEGTIDAFAAAVPDAVRQRITVTGPDDEPVSTDWLLLPDSSGRGIGVVELASTSGITLLSPLRALDAHTRGFGQAIAAALDAEVDSLVLAIGGSSSTDGGVGALTELGARFLDHSGSSIADGGRGLDELADIDLSSLRARPPGGVSVLTDVTNPLLGPVGAAAVFGPQKGATAGDIRRLEAGLRTLSRLLDPALAAVAGAGAAGGTGFGLLTWGATLTPGGDSVARMIGLSEAIRAADVVVTGEGSFDSQSAAGKVPSHVLAAASGTATRVALVAGRILAPTSEFEAALSLTELAGSAAESQSNTLAWLEVAGARLAGESEG